MSRVAVISLGIVLLACPALGSDVEDYGVRHYKAGRKLDVAGGRAICAMVDFTSKVVGESGAYYVDESERLAVLLSDDKRRVEYYCSQIENRLSERAGLEVEDVRKLRDMCKKSLEKAEKEEKEARASADAVRRTVGGAKEAAQKALGDDEIEKHKSANGLLKVVNWHCGGDVRQGERHPPYSHNCYVIGRRRPYSKGARNVIYCDGLRQSTPYQNVTGGKMRAALERWRKYRPTAKEGGKGKEECDATTGNYSGPGICTVWEGWIGDYIDATNQTHEVVKKLRSAERAQYGSETQLLVVYRIHKMLENDEVALRSVFENVSELDSERDKKMNASEETNAANEKTPGTLEAIVDIVLPANTEDEEATLIQAREEAPLGISTIVLVVAILVPLLILLLLLLLLKCQMEKKEDAEAQGEVGDKGGKKDEERDDDPMEASVLEGNVL